MLIQRLLFHNPTLPSFFPFCDRQYLHSVRPTTFTEHFVIGHLHSAYLFPDFFVFNTTHQFTPHKHHRRCVARRRISVTQIATWPSQQATLPTCRKIQISTSSPRSRPTTGYTLRLLELQRASTVLPPTAASPLPRPRGAIPCLLHTPTSRMPQVAMVDLRAIISRSTCAAPLSLRIGRQDWQIELPMQRKCA